MPELYSAAYLQRCRFKTLYSPALHFEPVSWHLQTYVSLLQTENKCDLPFECAKGALSVISASLNWDSVLSPGDEWNTTSALMGSLSSSDKINSRTQTTQQSRKTILSRNITSRSISALGEITLCPPLPTYHFFLCLLLGNGLPPSRGKRRFLSRSFMHSLFCTPSLTKAAGASEILQYC